MVLLIGLIFNYVSCDDLKWFWGGGVCDFSCLVIVGVGVVSRYFLLV